MAKLVDLLAKYLVEWPEGVNYIEQGLSGSLYSQSNVPVGFIKELSEDSVRVTYNEYISARDRLHADTLKEMIQVGGTLEVQEFDADQSLWDKVAVSALAKSIGTYPDDSTSEQVRYCFEYADAFMAERAKRLKGGV